MSFNCGNNFALGGLMGESPYSNVTVLDNFLIQSHQKLQSYRQAHGLVGQGQGRGFNRTQNSAFHQPGRGNTPLQAVAQNMTGQFQSPVVKFQLPEHVKKDLLCRFIMNIPQEEKFDPVRALFQVELAHWFFIDHYCTDEGDPALAGMGHIPFNQFAYIMFKEAPHLRQYFQNVDKYLAEFRKYRSRVPTYGAILMNRELTQVLMVQGFRNQWGFPKGKVNETEDPVECAIREVYEETGYDMRPLINQNHYIESKAQDRNDRLYLVRGVDQSFQFHPQTQYEIKQISWFNIDEIPEHKRDNNPRILEHGQPVSNFFTIYPYIKRLKLWIADKLEGKNRIQCFRSKFFTVQEDDENENFTTVEGYSPHNVASRSFGSQAPTSSKSMNTEDLRRALSGMQLTPNFVQAQDGQGQGQKSKGGRSKRRLFSEGDTERSKEKSAQEAASLLSSAMGIPFNIKTSNGSNPPGQSQQAETRTAKPPLSTSSITNTSKNPFNFNPMFVSTPSSSATKIKNPLADNFNVTVRSWEHFRFDEDRVKKALLCKPKPTPSFHLTTYKDFVE